MTNKMNTVKLLGAFLIAISTLSVKTAKADPVTLGGIIFEAYDVHNKIVIEFNYGTKGYWSRYSLALSDLRLTGADGGGAVIPGLNAAMYYEKIKQ